VYTQTVVNNDKNITTVIVCTMMTTARRALENGEQPEEGEKKHTHNPTVNRSIVGRRKDLVFNKPTWGTAVSYWSIDGGYK